MNLLIKHPDTVLCVCDPIFQKEGQKFERRFLTGTSNPLIISPEESISLFKDRFWIPGHCTIVKTEEIKKLGFFKEAFGPRCDWVLYHSLALRHKIGYIPEGLSVMSVHSGQYSRKKRSFEQIKKLWESIFQYLLLKENKDLKRSFKKGLLFLNLLGGKERDQTIKQFRRFLYMNPRFFSLCSLELLQAMRKIQKKIRKRKRQEITAFFPRRIAASLKRRRKRAEVKVSVPLSKIRFQRLLRIIKKHKLTPKKRDFLDFIKSTLAGYYISPGDTVFDIGAHLGLYTAFYSSLTGKKGRVYAYEAHPKIFEGLQEKLKKIKQATPCCFAASDESEKKIPMKIYPEAIHKQCSTVEPCLMNEKRMPGETDIVCVPCRKLDDHVDEVSFGKCSLIKIDVEGHEEAVIRGAGELLKRDRPVVIFEYGMIPGEWEPHTIELFQEKDYLVYDGKTLLRVVPGHSDTLTDLIAIPREGQEEFEALISLLR